MRKLFLCLFCLGGLSNCSQQQPVVKGRRVSLAKGNISFVLPDSSLAYGKPILWPADSAPNGDYGEAGANYFSLDSSTSVFVYVRAQPTGILAEAPWKVFANPKENKAVLLARNMNLAVIEKQSVDSLTHTVEFAYHLPKRLEKGWRGQASYNQDLMVYGNFRRVSINLVGPDTEAGRQAIATIHASLWINPAYLAAVAKPYPQREYRD